MLLGNLKEVKRIESKIHDKIINLLWFKQSVNASHDGVSIYYIKAFFAIFVLFVFFEIGLIGYSVWHHTHYDISTTPNSASFSLKSRVDTLNRFEPEALEIVKKQNWFGKYAPPTTTVKSPEKKISMTKLKLVLRGVASGADRIAVIENNGLQKSYLQGDVIDSSDAVIEEILIDRVVIKHRGNYEYLTLPEADQSNSSSHAMNEPEKVLPQNTHSNVSKKTVQSTKPEKIQAVVSTNLLSVIRQEILADPKEIMNHIHMTPVQKNGKLSGFRLSPGEDQTLFNERGIKANDIVIAINGHELTDTRQAISLMMQLQKHSSVDISVLRNGIRHEISIALQL